MFRLPFPIILRVAALNWIAAPGLASGFVYMLSVEYGAPTWLWKGLLFLAVGISSTLLLLSIVVRDAPSSVFWGMLFVGTFTTFPTMILTGALGLGYLVVVPPDTRPCIGLAVICAIVVWCLISVNRYKKRVNSKNFIQREFSIESARIIVRQPLKTNLDPPPISEHTFFGKLYHSIGPYLVMGIPMAYPIQRLLMDTGGMSAVLFLLALLSLPLTMYIFGRLACGAYLWIYKVWQLEREHGKPVVFDVGE